MISIAGAGPEIIHDITQYIICQPYPCSAVQTGIITVIRGINRLQGKAVAGKK